MVWRWILPLALATFSAAVGFALRWAQAMPTLANVLIALGLAVGASVVALSAAVLLRPRRAPLEAGAMERVNQLLTELFAAAEAVDRRGILALAEVALTRHEPVFRVGAARAIAAAEPEAIRAELTTLHAQSADAAVRRARRNAAFARAGAVVSLAAGLLVASQSVLPHLAGDTAGFSDAQALAVLLFTYAGCLMVIVGHAVSARADVLAREHDLAGALLVEAILLFRAGVPRTVVRESLQRLIAPGVPFAPPPAQSQRAAA